MKSGGRTHRVGVNGFVSACSELGVPESTAKRVFVLLDRSSPASQVVVEEDLGFLSLCESADQDAPELKSAAETRSFEFTVVLTREEYREYLRRRDAADRPVQLGHQNTSQPLHDVTRPHHHQRQTHDAPPCLSRDEEPELT